MDAQLRCLVSPGNGKTEYAVTVSSLLGQTISWSTGRGAVQCAALPTDDYSVPGLLHVRVLRTSDGLALVQLPSSTPENGCFITVPAEHLVAIGT